MAMTVEKDALLHFKHRHAFEITGFDWCDIVLLINQEWKKSFAGRYKNLYQLFTEDSYTCTGGYSRILLS